MKFHLHIKQIFFYGIGLTATKFLSIIMLPIVTKILNPSEYGTLEILQSFINILFTILCVGQSEAIFRYGGMAKKTQIIDKICINASIIVFIVSLVFVSIFLLFASKISLLLPGNTNTWQVIYLGLIMLPSSVLVIQFDWLRLKEKVSLFVRISLFRAFIQAGLVIIVLYAGYGVTGIMFATLISSTLILLYIMPIQVNGNLNFDRAIQKRLFFYGLPLIFSGMNEFVIMSSSIWWLAYEIGAAAMAKFALALKFSTLTFFLLQPFSLWWFPKRFKHLNTESDRYYCMQVSELGVVLGMLLAFSMTIGGSLFIHWFIPKNYQEAIIYLPLSCLVLVLKPVADMMNIGLLLEKTRIFMWINNLMALLTLIGLYFFIPLYHAWGVLYVLGFVLFLRWISCLYLSQKELYLPYRYKKLIIFIVTVCLCEASVWSMSTTTDYILKGGTLFLFLMFMAYFLELLPRLNQLINYNRSD